jgi:hypothetical protein
MSKHSTCVAKKSPGFCFQVALGELGAGRKCPITGEYTEIPGSGVPMARALLMGTPIVLAPSAK